MLGPLAVVAVVSCLKTLFLPFYRSTDFEVHRNWLAITHSLPLKSWYVDETSPWTLDYPPFFAWWEYFLSFFASRFDPAMLELTNLDYASPATVLFQRLSVIFGDLFLAWGTITCYQASKMATKASVTSLERLLVLVLANAGLLIVDHIHFQYNGFLFGFALQSIGCMLLGKPLQSAFWFCVLLNLKHIYLYCAPVYFVYLLRHYCMDTDSFGTFTKRILSLGLIVVSVCAVSFGPFIYLGQLGQVLSRLFPFKRGLCHAYWAPNFWALYNSVDKAAGIAMNVSKPASMTGGLVQQFDHSVLPSVPPLATFVLALLAMMPALVKLWMGKKDTKVDFLRALVLCNFASFMFGWHVHEKAILLIILPLIVLSLLNPDDAQELFLLTTTGNVSLLPLLFRPQESLLRAVIVVAYALLMARETPGKQTWPRRLYYLGLFGVVIFDSAIAPNVPALSRLPFLPLMLYSVYCSIGISFSWLKLYANFLLGGSQRRKQKVN